MKNHFEYLGYIWDELGKAVAPLPNTFPHFPSIWRRKHGMNLTDIKSIISICIPLYYHKNMNHATLLLSLLLEASLFPEHFVRNGFSPFVYGHTQTVKLFITLKGIMKKNYTVLVQQSSDFSKEFRYLETFCVCNSSRADISNTWAKNDKMLLFLLI